jgi:hypothetical protein
MPLDLTFVGYFLPIFAFLLVFVIMYALLSKTEILGESKFVQVLLSFVIAVIFISFSTIRQYVTSVVPWFVVLIIALFFILIIIGLSQKDFSIVKPWLSWVFVVALIVVFLIAAIVVFNKQFNPYLPGGNEQEGSTFLLNLKHFLYSAKFLGAILLLAIAALTAWAITRK